MDLVPFIEKKLDQYAANVIKGQDAQDEHALGELIFYMALRRVVTKNATMQDIGMMDAINDTLQEQGVIPAGEQFYMGYEKVR